MSYTATLPVREQTVLVASSLRHAERRRRGTRTGTRALGCLAPAVPVLRWLPGGTRLAQVAPARTAARTQLDDAARVLEAGNPRGARAA